MAINWILLSLMTGYAFFNGIGSFFYKNGLNKIDSSNVSFVSLKKKDLKVLLSLFLNPIWVLGLICLGIDFLIYQFALSRFEISAVKPLVNLNLIFVFFFGIIIMKEKIQFKEWIGLIFICIGAILISLTAEEQNTFINFQNLLLFLISTMIFVVLVILVSKKLDLTFEFHASIICGILYGLGSIFNKSLYAENITLIWFIIIIIFFITAYILAFLFGQSAYLKGRMTIVSLLVNILSIITPFLGGVLIFNDLLVLNHPNIIIRWSKIIGLFFTIVGIILTATNSAADTNRNKIVENIEKYDVVE